MYYALFENYNFSHLFFTLSNNYKPPVFQLVEHPDLYVGRAAGSNPSRETIKRINSLDFNHFGINERWNLFCCQ